MDSAELAQPEGQGDTGADTTPYGEYLSRIPEEARGVAEEAFKAWDANTTQRFQEAAEYRKQWEPYETVGAHELTPDEVAWHRQFNQVMRDNPQGIVDWAKEFAQQNGLQLVPAQQALPEPQQVEVGGWVDPSQQQLEQLLKAQLSPLQQQIEQMNQWRTEQIEAARFAEAKAFVENQVVELETKHPGLDRDMLERFMSPYVESDPQHAVARGYADMEAKINALTAQIMQDKVDAPAPAESAGAVDAAPPSIKGGLKGAELAAREWLKAANSR